MSRKWKFDAASETELKAALQKLDVDVGSRLKARSQAAKESYVLKHYFELLMRVNRIGYPITVRRNESPDFLVQDKGLAYGLEVTESTFQEYQYFLTESAKRKLTYSPSVFRYGETDNFEFVQKLLQASDGKPRTRVWNGVEAERDAASWAYDSLKKKVDVVSRWKERPRNLRICLYHNSPCWIRDTLAFSRCFSQLFRGDSENLMGFSLNEIKVDYLINEASLIYDMLGERLIIPKAR